MTTSQNSPTAVQDTGFIVAAEPAGEGEVLGVPEVDAVRARLNEGVVDGVEVEKVDAVEAEDEGEDDYEDEPTPGAKVEVLTEENFERVTQVSTGATTGDWFIGEITFFIVRYTGGRSWL